MKYRQWKKNYKKKYGANPPFELDKRKQRRYARKMARQINITLQTMMETLTKEIRTLTRVPSEFIHAKLDELAEEIGELAKPKWIPCSERIPEEPKENLVFDGKCLEVYLVTTKYGSSDQDKVYPFRAFWNGINFTDGWGILDVIAWMPLPEPYKEAEDE